MLDNKLIIDIPKGMEVDIEKSDLKAGIIAFKKRPFSYEDVISTLIDRGLSPVVANVTNSNVEKIVALDKLMDIANVIMEIGNRIGILKNASIISCEPANTVLLLVVFITKVLFTSRTKKMPKPLLIIRISEAFLMQSIRTKAYEGNVL